MPRIFRRDRPLVRPWALAGPILILMLAAPLLRPLRSPGRVAPPERVTVEAVRAILHDGTLALNTTRLQPGDPVYRTNGRVFSQDPPAYVAMLAGVGWGVERFGVTADENPHLFGYLLTLFAVALPTAVAGGLIYRTGRLFELRRPWRVVLALACVLASGWFAYATSLRPHAIAAAGVMAAITGAVQFASARRPGRAIAWLIVAGGCAGAAAVIEPLAVWAVAAVLLSVAAAKVSVGWRLAGVLMTLVGLAAPLTLHLTLNTLLTGDWQPPRWHATSAPAVPVADDEDDDLGLSASAGPGRGLGRIVTLTVGEHGFLSHFPVLLIGLTGAAWVVRRHWAGPFKVLAAMTLLSLAGALVYKSFGRPDVIDSGFAAPRLVVFTPAVLLWSGAWLRKRRGPVVWAFTGVALAISVASTVIGAAAVEPADGYSHYTLAEAVERMLSK